MRVYLVLIVVFLLGAEGQPINPVRLPAKVLRGASDTCPSNQDTVNVASELRQNISSILADSMTCGGIGWRRVGYLDMTDPTQSCPSGLALKTYSPGLRSCGRATNTPGCWSTFYNNTTAECVGGSGGTSLESPVHSLVEAKSILMWKE